MRDKIKAVLLKSEGWTKRAIGQTLSIHPETVAVHLRDWAREEKLKPEKVVLKSLKTNTGIRAKPARKDRPESIRPLLLCSTNMVSD